MHMEALTAVMVTAILRSRPSIRTATRFSNIKEIKDLVPGQRNEQTAKACSDGLCDPGHLSFSGRADYDFHCYRQC